MKLKPVSYTHLLSMSDFIKIRDVELPEDKPRLSVSRDMFLFACYAGTVSYTHLHNRVRMFISCKSTTFFSHTQSFHLVCCQQSHRQETGKGG